MPAAASDVFSAGCTPGLSARHCRASCSCLLLHLESQQSLGQTASFSINVEEHVGAQALCQLFTCPVCQASPRAQAFKTAPTRALL